MLWLLAAAAATVRSPSDRLELFDVSDSDAPSESGTAPQTGDATVCAVTANQAEAHPHAFHELFEACLAEDPSVQVVVLALQDLRATLPSPVQGFELRHQLAFDAETPTGENHFCYGHGLAGGVGAGAAAGAAIGFKVGASGYVAGPAVGAMSNFMGSVVGAVVGGLAGHFTKIGALVNANCGGVAVAVYSVPKFPVGAESDDDEVLVRTLSYAQDECEGDCGKHAQVRRASAEVTSTAVAQVSGSTWTTRKGTVALRLRVRGRPLVVASTHAAEGIRAKDGSPCDASTPQDPKELQRVQDFRQAADLIHDLRRGDAPALWGGDFNPRSADARGCPRFAQATQTPDEASAERDLAALRASRDVLGTDDQGAQVSFAAEAARVGMAEPEAAFRCPTYKKKEPGEKKRFYCRETAAAAWQSYDAKKPPSWTDRLFASDRVSCGSQKKVVHHDDHDAVFVVCRV